jgi:hypothetical protein
MKHFGDSQLTGPSASTRAIIRFAGRNVMLRQFLVGGAVSVGNIVIHALVMAELVWVVQFVRAKAAWQPSFRQLQTRAISAIAEMGQYRSLGERAYPYLSVGRRF